MLAQLHAKLLLFDRRHRLGATAERRCKSSSKRSDEGSPQSSRSFSCDGLRRQEFVWSSPLRARFVRPGFLRSSEMVAERYETNGNHSRQSTSLALIMVARSLTCLKPTAYFLLLSTSTPISLCRSISMPFSTLHRRRDLVSAKTRTLRQKKSKVKRLSLPLSALVSPYLVPVTGGQFNLAPQTTKCISSHGAEQ